VPTKTAITVVTNAVLYLNEIIEDFMSPAFERFCPDFLELY